MPSPPEPGTLTFEVDAIGASVQPSTIPVKLEFEVGTTRAVPVETLDINIADIEVELKIEGAELALATFAQQGPKGAPGLPGLATDVAASLDTTLVESGRMVYPVANGMVAHTDASQLPHANCVGVFNGVLGKVTVLGVAQALQFTSTSPTPTVGHPVFLARADDEMADGAAGKVTAAKPASGFIAPVGTVVAVESDFASTRVAKVMVRISDIFKRAS